MPAAKGSTRTPLGPMKHIENNNNKEERENNATIKDLKIEGTKHKMCSVQSWNTNEYHKKTSDPKLG